MKPDEVTTRSFKLYPTTDQAAKYACAGTFSLTSTAFWEGYSAEKEELQT